MRLRFAALMTALIAFAGLPTARAATPFWGDRVSQPLDEAPAQLKPGQFVWSPANAPAGPIVVLVDLDSQMAHVYRDGVMIGYAGVSTGKPGHATPTGVFQTLFKEVDHHSNKYNNASMPYTQRITQDGVALHAGGLPGYPSSHGCIHLPSAFAQLLFQASPLGTTVVVARAGHSASDLLQTTYASPIDAHGADVVQPALADRQAWRWEPEKAPEGPLALILSSADQRLIVMRNGVEIGRARVAISDPQVPLGSRVFVAKARNPGQSRTEWTAVDVPGRSDAGVDLSPADRSRAQLPPAFIPLLQPLIAPGTTLVVTDEPLLPHNSGVPLTVLTSSPDAA